MGKGSQQSAVSCQQWMMGFAIMSCVLFAGCKTSSSEPVSRVCFNEACWQVELAQTPEERSKGLMYRTELASDRGMLFVFEREGDHPFWMKNTRIPLDIIWLDDHKRVVYIKSSVPPCTEDPCAIYAPAKKSSFVLEISAGAAQKTGIATGSQLSF